MQKHATLTSGSLGRKQYSGGTQPQCPALLMTQINHTKLILLYYTKIFICKVRIIYEADRDPVINSTEKQPNAAIDKLAVATEFFWKKKKIQILFIGTVFHSSKFALALS